MRLLLIVLFMVSVPIVGFSEPNYVGVVSDIENDVILVSGGKEEKLKVGMFVGKGSKIITNKTSRAKLMMMDDTLLIIAPNTEFTIDDYFVCKDKKSRKSVLGVIRGKVLFYVNKVFSGSDSKFEVKTKSSIAGVRGTKFIVETGEKEFIGVINGEVELKTEGKEIILTSGKCVDSSKGFVVAELESSVLQEYTEGFQIKRGKTQFAMLEKGTGMTGDALLEQGVRSRSYEKLSLKGTGDVEVREKRTEEIGEIRESRDSGDGFDVTENIDYRGGSDVYGTKGGSKAIVRIKILLPFVKVGR